MLHINRISFKKISKMQSCALAIAVNMAGHNSSWREVVH